jgi:branched-chain amino acid transport system substrate-binding protein
MVMCGLLVGCNGGSNTTDTTGTTGVTAGDTGTATTARKLPTAAGNTATGTTIPIGLVASQNGDLKPWGEDSVKGARLAVEEFNNSGGVNGKKIDLRIGDSGSRPEQGKSAAEKLMSDGAIAVVGEVASGITAQIAQAAYEKGVPVVAVGATRTDLTDIGGHVFRVCYTDDFQGPVMAKFAYDGLGLRKVALLTDQRQPYSTGLSNSFRDYFKKLGGAIVDEQFYNSQDTDFKGQLTNVKAKNPDGLFMSGYFTETGPIARQAADLGLKVPMLGGDGWDSNEILTTGGQAILGSYFCNHYNNKEDRPEVKQFLSKWRAKYKSEPATTMGALAYDATMLTLDALKRAESPSSKALINAIDTTEGFKGVSGEITLNGMAGNPRKRAIVVELTPQGQKFAKAYEYADVFPDTGAAS